MSLIDFVRLNFFPQAKKLQANASGRKQDRKEGNSPEFSGGKAVMGSARTGRQIDRRERRELLDNSSNEGKVRQMSDKCHMTPGEIRFCSDNWRFMAFAGLRC